MVLRNTILLGSILTFCSFYLNRGSCSRITLSEGLYNDILVALHPVTDDYDCISLIRNITEAVQFTSAQLNTATEGKVSFGSIKILIPSTWGEGLSKCGSLPKENITLAAQYDLYENADFKLSKTHPFAEKLPWTKQYKGCENESDSINVPIGFFRNSDFDSETRGKILLAEWAKFRYGVFDEHGYASDPIFLSCYASEGKIFYTSCTNSLLEAMSNSDISVDPKICDELFFQNSEILKDKLTTKSSSILFAPYLKSMTQFCTNDQNIGLSPSKQNIICERKSVSEVIFKHPDFSSNEILTDAEDAELFPNTRRLPRPRIKNSPEISLIRRDGNFDQGYAFILEDDASMREYGRVQHIKQSIAKILQLIKPRTHVGILRFEGSDYAQFFRKVVTDSDKSQILDKIPDLNSPGLSSFLTEKFARSRVNQINYAVNRVRKKNSILKILEILNGYQSEQWHIVLISSNPPGDLMDAIPNLSKASHALTIITYDESKEWLQFNRIPNTKNILFLPSCADNPYQCYGSSSLFVDYFGEILASNSSSLRHFINKVVEFEFIGEKEATFTISNEDYVDNLEDFQLFLPVYSLDPTVYLISPRNIICPVSILLNYNYVFKFDTSQETGCPYQVGEWKIKVTENIKNGVAASNFKLYGIGETSSDSESSLVTSISFGKSLYSEIFPTTGVLPIYVSVSTVFEQPVINADVILKVIHDDPYITNLNTTLLKDNGMDPDLFENDGIYSAYVTTYSPSASFHSGHVMVKTSRLKSKKIVNLNFINGGEAALPDSRMIEKCCGSLIPIGLLEDMSTSSYARVIPSFRTGENTEPNSDIYPPSRIQSQIVYHDRETFVVLEFVAPGSDFWVGTVAGYDMCCTNSSNGNLDDSMCIRIQSSTVITCNPVPGGSTQVCAVRKSQLAQQFLNHSDLSYILYCSIRGADLAGNTGRLSFGLIEIRLNADELNEAVSPECKSIKDGCLHIDVFWALIGCIGGLVFILFVVLFCWCFLTMKEQSKAKNKNVAPTETEGKWSRNSNWIDGLGAEPINNVYINQAYIQDSNGQLQLVASNGVLHSPSTSEKVSHRSLSATATDMVEHHDRKHLSWNQDAKSSSMTALGDIDIEAQQMRTFQRPSPSIHSNSSHKTGSNSRLVVKPPKNSSIQSISSAVDQGEQDNGPVYASVSRMGRKPNHPYFVKNTGQRYAPPSQRKRDNLTPSPNLVVPQKTKISERPTSADYELKTLRPTTPVITFTNRRGTYTPEQSRLHPLPPVRLDHFPDSETDAYSDISQIVHVNNNKNPVPASSTLSRERPKKATSLEETRASKTFQDIPSKNPIYKSMEIQRPNSTPPPPPLPPRRESKHGENHEKRSLKNRNSDISPNNDDDSDTWDNYENNVDFQFKYNPGISYA